MLSGELRDNEDPECQDMLRTMREACKEQREQREQNETKSQEQLIADQAPRFWPMSVSIGLVTLKG